MVLLEKKTFKWYITILCDSSGKKLQKALVLIVNLLVSTS